MLWRKGRTVRFEKFEPVKAVRIKKWLIRTYQALKTNEMSILITEDAGGRISKSVLLYGRRCGFNQRRW
jgi:hypothetical protein